MSTSREAAEQVVKSAAASIMEHYEAVQIIATRPTEGRGTECFTWGRGNWYARKGMVDYASAKFDEDPREEARNDNRERQED